MFSYLRQLVARVLDKPEWLDGLPEDPSVSVREPRRRNPNGRSSAIALAEPEESSFVEAIGTAATRASVPSHDHLGSPTSAYPAQ